jgi:hypothetical protein
MCKVELHAGQLLSRIKAIITGPPNGHEISRTEFVFGQEASPSALPFAEVGPMRIVGPTPQDVAQEIVAGIVIGKFD